jgi:hypothetical protein
MKTTVLNSHVSCTPYSCKSFYVKGIYTLLLLLLLLLIVKNTKESAMTCYVSFDMDNIPLGRYVKPGLPAKSQRDDGILNFLYSTSALYLKHNIDGLDTSTLHLSHI